MTSIQTTLLIAGAAALVGATAASAQTANRADRGPHNSDGTYGLHTHTSRIGDTLIDVVSENGRLVAIARTPRADRTVAAATAPATTVIAR